LFYGQNCLRTLGHQEAYFELTAQKIVKVLLMLLIAGT